MRRGWWLVAVALAVGCGQAAEAPPEPSLALASLLPQPAALVGWSAAEGPVEYRPETLFEYLDGGAERYTTYGFRCLLHVRYQRGDDPGAAVVLDLFDMAGELGAFGLYSGLRPAEATFHPWGAEGYRSGTVAAAWKGSLLVHAEADADRPELVEMVEQLVAGACERAPGAAAPPAILAALPPEGLVPRSERWLAADLLGHECLPGGVQASYLVGGRRGELFWSRLESRPAASRALATLRAHYAGTGTVEDDAAGRGFRFTDPDLGAGEMVAAGPVVAGAWGDLAPEARERLLSELTGRLAAGG